MKSKNLKNVVFEVFSILCLKEVFSLKDQGGLWFVTDSVASPYHGHSKPFSVVINETIFVFEVFILNCHAWKLMIFVAFSAIPDFHYVDLHFVKNLFLFQAFSSRHIISPEKYKLNSLFWRLLDAIVNYSLLIKHAYMRAM